MIPPRLPRQSVLLPHLRPLPLPLPQEQVPPASPRPLLLAEPPPLPLHPLQSVSPLLQLLAVAPAVVPSLLLSSRVCP